MRLLIMAASVFLCLYVSGCAVIQKLKMPTVVRIKGLPETFEIGAIVRTATGEVVSFEELMADLEHVRIVYIGEKHSNEAHHNVQLKILKALYEKDPRLLVGMEMFVNADQHVLDQWRAGKLDQETFLKEVDWENTWKFDFSLYRAVLDFIREASLKLVGLNIPHAIVEKVAREGLDALSDEERKQIAQEIDTSNEEHKAYVKTVFGTHESDEISIFESFYEAQCVWEDSMAEAISRALNNKRMVVLTGNGHIAYKFGIPDRAFKRTKASFQTVMPVAVGTEVDRDMADYFWVTPAKKQADRSRLCHRGPKRPLVGIRLKTLDQGKGVLIVGVLPKSPAARAGIKPQDILVAIDGNPVSRLSDIHNAIAGAEGASTTYLFKIDRQGELMELMIQINKTDPASKEASP
ncbi:MAG: hypothetical protein DRH17_05620 [Deltaproteobacteria bacterium]|nr:MAG: hypothetical protein DRH17_05620 [Deltaproteobacteria bacterium]